MDTLCFCPNCLSDPDKHLRLRKHSKEQLDLCSKAAAKGRLGQELASTVTALMFNTNELESNLRWDILRKIMLFLQKATIIRGVAEAWSAGYKAFLDGTKGDPSDIALASLTELGASTEVDLHKEADQIFNLLRACPQWPAWEAEMKKAAEAAGRTQPQPNHPSTPRKQ